MAHSASIMDRRATTHPAPVSPPATRIPRRRWRDWRLALGVLLVLGSAALGARVIGAADDTVAIWAAGTDLIAGSELDADSLVAVPARIESEVNPYLTGSVPDGYVVTRDVGAGELLPAAAVADAAEARRATRLVAVSLTPESVPGSLSTGDRVDVWLVPDLLAEPDEPASMLVPGVTVATASQIDSGFGAATTPGSVVLSLDAQLLAGRDLQDVTSRLVAGSAAGRLVLTLDPTPR